MVKPSELLAAAPAASEPIVVYTGPTRTGAALIAAVAADSEKPATTRHRGKKTQTAAKKPEVPAEPKADAKSDAKPEPKPAAARHANAKPDAAPKAAEKPVAAADKPSVKPAKPKTAAKPKTTSDAQPGDQKPPAPHS
jgi:D-alanyl-D-alanine carboxypeptidase